MKIEGDQKYSCMINLVNRALAILVLHQVLSLSLSIRGDDDEREFSILFTSQLLTR